MDRLTTLELFVRVVERRSFTAAAADLGVSRPAATEAIQQLERRLGVRLLRRTTRQVAPTPEGEDYHRRSVAILAELEDADRAAGGELSGLVRADVPGNLARTLLLPELPAFLARHPSLMVHLGESERYVDLMREGVDCVVRAGETPDSDLTIRRLGVFEEVTCASPAYLAAHGVPAGLADLAGHVMVGFVSSRTGGVLPLEFTRDGEVVEVTPPARVLVAGADLSVAAARLGLGLVQTPRRRVAEDLAAGVLVEVLPQHPPTPTPISILFPPHRQLSPRVRVFVDWLVGLLEPNLAEA